MALSTERKSLPLLLRRLWTRPSSIFLKRLIFYAEEEEEGPRVRHYDLQCEGIEVLAGCLKAKRQNVLFRAFAGLKGWQGDKDKPQAKKAVGTTRRTVGNTTFTSETPRRRAGAAIVREESGRSEVGGVDLTGLL